MEKHIIVVPNNGVQRVFGAEDSSGSNDIRRFEAKHGKFGTSKGEYVSEEMSCSVIVWFE